MCAGSATAAALAENSAQRVNFDFEIAFETHYNRRLEASSALTELGFRTLLPTDNVTLLLARDIVLKFPDGIEEPRFIPDCSPKYFKLTLSKLQLPRKFWKKATKGGTNGNSGRIHVCGCNCNVYKDRKTIEISIHIAERYERGTYVPRLILAAQSIARIDYLVRGLAKLHAGDELYDGVADLFDSCWWS